MKFIKCKSLLIFIILIFSCITVYAQDNSTDIYLSFYSGREDDYKLKTYKGPFTNMNEAIANWIYDNLPENDKYAISENNKVLLTRNPEETYSLLFNSIIEEFKNDRMRTFQKYNIIPDEKREKDFQKREKVFFKYVHPKEYLFDVAQNEKELFLKAEENDAFLSATVDFTSLCSNDLPQVDDRICVYYNFKTTNDIDNLVIQLYAVDFYDKHTFIDEYPVAEQLSKNQNIDGIAKFLLKQSCPKKVYIKLVSTKVENKKSKQTYLKLKKSIESTNTIKEAEEEIKAGKAGYKILESRNHELYEIVKQREAEILRIEQEKKQKEEDEKRRQQELIEQERRAIEEEKLKLQREREEQEAFWKALEEASKNDAARYKKEYLQDSEKEISEKMEATEFVTQPYLSDPNEIDASGKTLLMKAAKSGNDWQINTLLSAGADVNIKDKDGWTALMYAVRYQENLNAVKLLIDAQADIFVENNFKTSALTLATCYNTNPEIIVELLKYYDQSNRDVLKSLTMLFVSSQPSEYVQIAKLNAFLNKGVPINTFYEGKTPLMFACQYGNSTEAIKILIENKAVVTVRSSEGKTAYDYASKNTHLQHDDIYWSLNRKKAQY